MSTVSARHLDPALRRGDMKRRLGPLVPASAVAAAAWVWLEWISPPIFPINDDAIRDQLLVRDCTDLGLCHLLGAPASFGGFHHGAVWIELLTAVRLLGGDLMTQRMMVLVCLALSAATLFVVVWQWLRPSMALPAAVFLIGVLSLDMPATLLINPSIAILPDILTTGGLLCYGLSRQRRFLLLSAFSLGVAMSVHTASLSLLAPFLIIVAVARPHAWRAVVPALAIAVLVYAVPSSATLRANLLALSEHGRLLPIMAGSVATVLVASACGSRFRRLSWDRRAWAIGALLIAPFALLMLWLLVVQRHHFSVIYLHPILAPASALAAALVTLPFAWLGRRQRLVRWVPTTVAAGALATMTVMAWTSAVPHETASSTWDIAETEIVARHTAERGWSYEDLVFRLQGSACRELLAGMSSVAPAPRRAPTPGRLQLQVVKAPRAAFGAQGALIPLGSYAVLMREVDSWLQPRALKACRRPVDSASAPLCTAATPLAPDAHTPGRFLFIGRSFPLIGDLDQQARPYLATYEIPLAPMAGSRELAVTDNHWSPCGWRITRVEGVQVEGSLPARRVRLHATGSGAGLVVFEKPFGVPGCPLGDIDTHYPPCVLETPPGDPLQDLVGR